MAANPLATNIVNAAIQLDAAIAAFKAAAEIIRTNEVQLLRQLGSNANTFLLGRGGLAGIGEGKISNTPPDVRSCEAIARAAWAAELA